MIHVLTTAVICKTNQQQHGNAWKLKWTVPRVPAVVPWSTPSGSGLLSSDSFDGFCCALLSLG
eukprot:766717-Hanusia_phi.AAC.2